MASEIKHPIEDDNEVIAKTELESRTVLDLEKMTCASCAMRIEKGAGSKGCECQLSH